MEIVPSLNVVNVNVLQNWRILCALVQAYTVFAPLFDPIIEEYHGGFSADQVHPPSDFGDAAMFGDLDPDNK